jgi:hypothetical protein
MTRDWRLACGLAEITGPEGKGEREDQLHPTSFFAGYAKVRAGLILWLSMNQLRIQSIHWAYLVLALVLSCRFHAIFDLFVITFKSKSLLSPKPAAAIQLPLHMDSLTRLLC